MNDVTIYTKPGCPHCAAAKDNLRQRGIGYTEHNVQADRKALAKMLELNGGRRHVPTIIEDGSVVVGFHGY